MNKYVIIFSIILCATLTSVTMAQEQYRAMPFGPDLIDRSKSAFALSIAPDGNSFYFTQIDSLPDGTQGGVLYESRLVGNTWGEPRVLEFSGQYEDYDPVPSPDGSRIYFMSVRPIGGTEPRPDNDMWVVARKGTGWGEPKHLGPVVNSDAYDGNPGVTKDGTLYFFSTRPGGVGSSDMYRSRLVDGDYTKPENLGPPVNTEHWEGPHYIDPSERFLLFYSGRPGGYGRGGDLYVSYYTAEGWSKPENLGPVVNTEDSSITPFIGLDKKWLYFGRVDQQKNKTLFYIDIKATPIDLDLLSATN
jgi:hypothetical protein